MTTTARVRNFPSLLVSKSSDQFFIQTVRILTFLFLILFTILNYVINDDFIHWDLSRNVYILASIGLLANLIVFLTSDTVFKNKNLLLLTFANDSFLLLLLFFTVQLNQSLFLLLFIINILCVGLVFGRKPALITASIISVCFSWQYALLPDPRTSTTLFLNILSVSTFFVIAVFSGQVHNQLSFFVQRLDAQNLNFNVIKRLNEILIEHLPLGLLTLNQRLEVLNYNPYLQNIFLNIPNLNAIKGQDLSNILPTLPFQELKVKGKADFVFEGKILRGTFFKPSDDLEFLALEDLTEIKNLERTVRQSEKLAAIGQLAAGIAHEIRNPLASISGSVELLSQNFKSAEDQKLSKIILKEIDRLNKLITEFLDYAKPEKEPADIVKLEDLLEEIKTALQNQYGQNLSLEFHKVKAVILGDRDKLKQAFLNIMINGVQSMESLPMKQLSVLMEKFEDTVEIKIKDKGSGIDAKILDKVFDPFFTTKPKGTGLGLAVTHKIIQLHKGGIQVSSHVGLGTEFKISFPLKM